MSETKIIEGVEGDAAVQLISRLPLIRIRTKGIFSKESLGIVLLNVEPEERTPLEDRCYIDTGCTQWINHGTMTVQATR